MEAIKAVLFDFDGVVVQSERIHMKTFLQMLSQYSVSVTEDRWYRDFSGTGSRHIFEVLVRENHLEKKISVDTLVEKRKKAYEEYVSKGLVRETTGVFDFLKFLRSENIKTAIVSGSHRTNVNAALQKLALSDFFDLIVSGDDLKERKPEPGPYLHAAKMLHISPSNCLVIEDAVAGCESAKRAGMRFVVINSPASKYLKGFEALINDFSEFPLEMFHYDKA